MHFLEVLVLCWQIHSISLPPESSGNLYDDGEGDTKPLGVIGMGKRVYEEGGPAAFSVVWQARVGYRAPAISIFVLLLLC